MEEMEMQEEVGDKGYEIGECKINRIEDKFCRGIRGGIWHREDESISR